MYVTNQWRPGDSTGRLPSRGNTLVCQWVAQNWTFGLRMAPGDPCYDPNAVQYTIGVLGASYVPNLQSIFTLTASTGRVRLLQMGMQQAMQVAPYNTSACARMGWRGGVWGRGGACA